MSLTAAQRSRYARHLLLREVGEQGQARLCEAEVAVTQAADEDAAAIARDYLGRAGITVADAAPLECDVSTGDEVTRLAGGPLLRDAAAALAGAFAAVETIKQITGAGQPGQLPAEFSLGPVRPSHRAAKEAT